MVKPVVEQASICHGGFSRRFKSPARRGLKSRSQAKARPTEKL